MRIPIREQLGLLVLACSLLSLMVLALATVSTLSTTYLESVLTPAVVPKSRFHHQHTPVQPLLDRKLEGCPSVRYHPPIPIAGEIGRYKSLNTKRFAALPKWYFDRVSFI